MEIAYIVISLIVILISLTFHEYSHAWMANHLGDPTAKKLGRMSLNPLVHIDPIGTVILPLILSALGMGAFGWAKPVPVNPANLRKPRRDDALVSAAGPLANLMLAIAGSSVIRVVALTGSDSNAMGFILTILFILIRVNILLMLFNLLPIIPLDGSGVIQFFLSPRSLFNYQQISQKLSMVFLLIVLSTNWIGRFYLVPVGNIFLFILQKIAGLELMFQ